MKNKTLIKYLISSGFILVFMALVLFGIFEQNKKSQELSNIVEEVKTLEEEKAYNKRKIDDLEKEYKGKLKEKATAQILFTKPYKKVYTQFYYPMNEKGVKGIIALSPKNFIGKENCISRNEFNEMIKSGWEYAVIWDGEGDFNDFMRTVKDTFYAEKLTMPKTIYFESKTYSNKYNKTIQKYGFNTVIHHGEEKLSLISGEFTEPIWFIGTAPVLSTKESINVSQLLKKRGNIVYNVELDKIDERVPINAIIEIITSFKDLERKNPFLICTIAPARNIHGKLTIEDKMLNAQYQKKRQVFEEKIKELDDKIDKIYYGNIND